MNGKLSLAVIIPVFNEEQHIERAIASVKEIASQVFVIDSGSTDRTVEIAVSLGAQSLQIPAISFSQKINDALVNAPIASNWVMRLDADEYVEADLLKLINEKLMRLAPNISGVYVKRKYVFLERWISHGGRYPQWELRLWRRGQAHMEYRMLDEQMVVDCGETVRFAGNLTDHNLSNLTTFIRKHNSYATSEAMEVLNDRYGLIVRQRPLSLASTSRQAVVKRFLKERVYNHLPIWLGPLCYFLYRYFLRGGFWDGKAGLIYHFMQGFWYRFLVGAKVYELERLIAGIQDRAAIKAKIEQFCGRPLL